MTKMKKLIILFMVVSLGLMISCEKPETDPKLDMSQAVTSAINAPESGSTFELLEEEAANVLTNIAWSAVSYNLTNLEYTNYEIQMDFADSNFVSPVIIATTNETSYDVTVGDMNTLLINKGAVAEETAMVEIRIFSYLNKDSDASYLYSEVIPLSMIPYTTDLVYPSLYVPGDYQGWNPAEAPKIYDFDDDGVYTGYVFMPEGGSLEFKFTSEASWDGTNYGYLDEGTLDTDGGAGNLSVPEAGGYYFEVDVNNLTWTLELQNWGVIGQWLDWGDDIDLEWFHDPAEDLQYLTVTVPGIPAADDQRFKYRANDDWEINLGDDDGDGYMNAGGADIPIPDGGTITFYLDFTKGPDAFYWFETE